MTEIDRLTQELRRNTEVAFLLRRIHMHPAISEPCMGLAGYACKRLVTHDTDAGYICDQHAKPEALEAVRVRWKLSTGFVVTELLDAKLRRRLDALTPTQGEDVLMRP